MDYDDEMGNLVFRDRLAEFGLREAAVWEDADNILARLDRSPIGNLAITNEVILKAIKLALMQELHYDVGELAARDSGYVSILRELQVEISGMEDDITTLGFENDDPALISRAMSETAFWGIGYSWFDYYDYDVIELSDAFNWLKMLRAVVSMPPEFHKFYQAGIWDYDVISGVLSNDIDMELFSKVIE